MKKDVEVRIEYAVEYSTSLRAAYPTTRWQFSTRDDAVEFLHAVKARGAGVAELQQREVFYGDWKGES